MIARGDMGVEIPPEYVPVIQQKIIQKFTQQENRLLQQHRCLTP